MLLCAMLDWFWLVYIFIIVNALSIASISFDYSTLFKQAFFEPCKCQHADAIGPNVTPAVQVTAAFLQRYERLSRIKVVRRTDCCTETFYSASNFASVTAVLQGYIVTLGLIHRVDSGSSLPLEEQSATEGIRLIMHPFCN